MNVQFRLFDEEQSGASVDLEHGVTYRVGNSPQFDIYIASSQNIPEGSEYFDFSIEGNIIYFHQNANKVTYVDFIKHKQNLVDQSYTYEVPCLFEFLGSKFSICDENDSWEKWIEIIHTKPEVVTQSSQEEPEMSSEEISELNKMYPKVEVTKDPNPLQNIMAKIFPKNKKLIAFMTTGCVLVAILFAAVLVVQKYSKENAIKNQKSASVGDMQAIKQIEVNLPPRFGNLKFMSNQADLVIVLGVVKNQDDINFLMKAFEKYKKIVTFKLITSDQAIQRLNSILTSHQITLVTPTYNPTTNRLGLSGLLNSMDAINEIELAVSNQIPEVSDLDASQVYALSDVDKDFDDLIAKNNLSSRITLKKNLPARTVYIGGYLNSSEMNDLKTGVSELTAKYQNLIQVTLEIKDVASSLPFKIVAVNTSGFPSFMTSDGQKVFEGGEIQGLKVDKITPTEIIFSGKFPLVYKLDDGTTGMGGTATTTSPPAGPVKY